MARGPRARTAPDSLVVVDKPSGMTSHDVVARVRRLAGTRKVGHAGTLDPMATGVLLVGVERTTRLLGHLALTDKAYSATVRLGASTVTDDAEGDVVATADASGITVDDVEAALVALRGDILQRPSAVSAIKVDGVRSYKRVREGEDVELPARPVTVSRFDVVASSYGDGVLDLDVEVECSTGTYVRALARDLGAALGVGGHLTALRRTRVGAFGLDRARTLEQLVESFDAVPLAEVVRDSFGVVEVEEADVDPVLHGARVASAYAGPSPVGVLAPDGRILSLAEPTDGRLVPLVVFS
ncbi:MAG: tRNA pseudouridine(55) synthase TruB [Candidatus Nanopelagicales bacterium]